MIYVVVFLYSNIYFMQDFPLAEEHIKQINDAEEKILQQEKTQSDSNSHCLLLELGVCAFQREKGTLR